MDHKPWLGSDLSWAGWIPTVSGQLSFSIIGHSSAASNCIYFNDLLPQMDRDPPVRYIALHQHRTAPDFPCPDWLTRRLIPGASYDFVLLAETSDAEIHVNLPTSPDGMSRVTAVHNAQGVLKGKVHIQERTRQKASFGRYVH
jgi:hypothetical protein